MQNLLIKRHCLANRPLSGSVASIPMFVRDAPASGFFYENILKVLIVATKQLLEEK